MKTLINFFTISFIFGLNSLLFQSNINGLFAQPDIFLTSEWHLLEGEVDGESISVQDLGGGVFYRVVNTESFLIRYGHSCFEFITVPYTNVTESTFTLGLIEDYSSCEYSDPDELIAVELYNSLFFETPIDDNGTPKNPFTYTYVETPGDNLGLLITNANGDSALFVTAQLANIDDFFVNDFAIFPNPVKETLHINNTSNLTVKAIIFDLNGKLFQSHLIEAGQSQIDVNQLQSGLYFVVFESEVGERVSKKFVKQ